MRESRNSPSPVRRLPSATGSARAARHDFGPSHQIGPLGRQDLAAPADLTGATLADSEWDDDEAGDRPWEWATLCDTILPADATVSGDRDCPRGSSSPGIANLLRGP